MIEPREYGIKIEDSNNSDYINRILVGTPSTGLVRMEWVQARYGQIIPVNWSNVQMIQWMNGYIPLRYQVDDAQNMIIREAIKGDFEWLLLIEHDTCPPPDAFIRFNQYIKDGKVPIVSGLYYTRSRPSEPLTFRGRGTSTYTDWKPGDLVWCDGIPTGMLLIHNSIYKTMWNESPEYNIAGQITRRVFETPRNQWFDPQLNQFNTISGTSDLSWCERIMKENFFEKSGWSEYQKMEFPFLVDTNIFCIHIDQEGIKYP